MKANANQDPPVTQQSTTTYYQLRGEAVNDPETFARENLADPAFLASMPRAQVNELIGLQASVAKNDKDQQQRQVASQHQLAVMTPDLLAAGIDPKKATMDPAIRANLLSFTGQLQAGVAKFMAANKGQAPDDDQIKAMGETLLTPGYLKGTGSLWVLLPDDTSAPLYQASASGKSSRFYPAVQVDRQQIIAAYGARYKGAVPTDAQIQAYYMAGRQPPAQPGPRSTLIKSSGASPFASAAPATGAPVNARPAPTSDQAEHYN